MQLKSSFNTIRNTSLILLVSLGITSYAQSVSPNDQLYWKRYNTFTYRPYNAYLPVAYLKQDDFIKQRGIKEYMVHTKHFKDNGKARKIWFYHTFSFDTAGRCIGLKGGKFDKPVSWSNSFKYNEKGYMYVMESRDKEGELSGVQQHNYYKDTPGLYDFVKMNGVGDTLEYTIRKPRDTASQTSYDYYFKKGKLKYTWFNEYYPDGQNKRTTVTNKKGKVEYVWDFKCKEDGVETAKHIDTSTMCVSIEYDKDSVLTKVSMTVDSRGTMYKVVEKQNKYKKLLSYKKTNETKGYLVSEYSNTYAADEKTVLVHNYKYCLKGKVRSDTKTTYDVQGNMLSKQVKTYKKGVEQKRTNVVYEYDSENRPIARKSLLANGSPSQITLFKYN